MKIKKNLIFNLIVALVATGYLVFAGILLDEHRDQAKCTKVEINIAHTSPYEFITDSTIKQWMSLDSTPTLGAKLKEIQIRRIHDHLGQQLYVDSCLVYSTIDGILSINVSQAVPLLRIKTENGYDFYIDSTLKILPPQNHYRAPVPIVSGNAAFGFRAGYYGRLDSQKNREDLDYLKKIANFVTYVQSDEFLREFIVQIYRTPVGEIELIPRVGNQIILLGTLEQYPEKLEKLKKFYLNSFSQEWWATAKQVNLKFEDQVIVS